MKKFMIAAIFALTTIPAHAQSVREFNGYSMLISVNQNEAEKADQKAQEICASLGKSAERQYRERTPQSRYLIFYICL